MCDLYDNFASGALSIALQKIVDYGMMGYSAKSFFSEYQSWRQFADYLKQRPNVVMFKEFPVWC